MAVVFTVLYVVVLIFTLVLFVRFVLDWVQFFAHEWRPRGVMLVVAEAVYSVTDPPLKALRRVMPPVNLGGMRLDLGFMVLVLVCWVLLGIFGSLAR